MDEHHPHSTGEQPSHGQPSHDQHSHHQPGRHVHGTGPGTEAETAAMIELLDLDAEVLHAHRTEVVDWIHELAADSPIHRALDLGAGTGSGALALAQRFEGAQVLALDVSAQMLARLAEKARVLGLAERVRTLEADLDAPWPPLDPADLVWASNSLHHMADPDRVLAEILATLRPGGLLALVEMDSLPRFLPEELGTGPGRAGLEERSHAALRVGVADALPHLGADWGPRLSAAGFADTARRHFTIDLKPPLPASAGRYAQASLRRLRSGLDDLASAEDLAALDTLIDGAGPEGVLRREDLSVRAERTVWVARRP